MAQERTNTHTHTHTHTHTNVFSPEKSTRISSGGCDFPVLLIANKIISHFRKTIDLIPCGVEMIIGLLSRRSGPRPNKKLEFCSCDVRMLFLTLDPGQRGPRKGPELSSHPDSCCRICSKNKTKQKTIAKKVLEKRSNPLCAHPYSYMFVEFFLERYRRVKG